MPLLVWAFERLANRKRGINILNFNGSRINIIALLEMVIRFKKQCNIFQNIFIMTERIFLHSLFGIVLLLTVLVASASEVL